MSANFRLGSLILAAGALVTAFGAGDLWGWAIVFVTLGLFGAIGSRRLRASLGTFWLVIFVIAAAIGMIIGLPAWPLSVAVLAALAHWDLDAFNYRLSRADPTDSTRRLEKSHLLRLLIVLGLGMAVSLLALSIRINLSLVWAMLLVLVIVVGLRLGIGALMNVAPSKPAK